MNPKCHICDTESKFLLKKDGFDLYECPDCKLVFVWPQPAAKALSETLYSWESGYQRDRAHQNLSEIKEQKRFSLVLDFFQKINPEGKMLDVGCGNGQMLYWATKRGLKPYGVEVNKRTAEWAKENGFEVFIGFLEESRYEESFFDFIFLGEVIEHVNSPQALIKKCRALLKDEGVIGITTPNIDCWWSRFTFRYYKIFGMPWSSVTPPYHLFQFSPRNLDLLMKKEGFGFVSGAFLRIPPLRYELGMLHLLKRYKETKKAKDFIFMVSGYALYALTHTFFKVLHPLLKKDFNMIRIYKKNSGEWPKA